MRLFLLLVLCCNATASAANATCEGCATALQMQDTVRSSLRSEDTAHALRELVTDNRVALQKLQDAIDRHGRAMEKITEAQARAMEKTTEAQARAMEKTTEAQASAAEKSNVRLTAMEKSIEELKSYGVYLVLGLIGPAVLFILWYPQRCIAMLRAYIGLGPGGAQLPPR